MKVVKAKKQIASNMAKAEASGFRLQKGRETPHLATCKAEDCVILGGLGAFGNGIMAFRLSAYGPAQRGTPDFATAKQANAYVAKTYGFGAINIQEESK